MKLIDAANSLDFHGWLRGIVGAGISGGSAAVSSAIVLPSLDADHFSILHARFWIAAFALSGTASLVSIAKFLSAEPLPAMKTVTSTVETVKTKGPTVVTSTVQETRTEPVSPAAPKESI